MDPEAILALPLTSTSDIAVTADKLYVSGWSDEVPGLYGCEKKRCQATFQRLPNVKESIHTLQVYEGRLAVTGGDGTAWLGSYALPSASDRQVTIDKQPFQAPIEPLFHGGFVYWGLWAETQGDRGTFRCALSDCPGVPTRIFDSYVWPRAAGDQIFWTDRGYVYRAPELADAPPQQLLADEMLSEAPADAPEEASVDYALVAIPSGGLLYGLVYAASTFTCYEEPCGPKLVRWPVGGGTREDLLTFDQDVSQFYVFESELVWVTPYEVREAGGTLSSCLAEDCEATRRDLGRVRYDTRSIVADAHYLYWLEFAQLGETDYRMPEATFTDVEVRRVARLGSP